MGIDRLGQAREKARLTHRLTRLGMSSQVRKAVACRLRKRFIPHIFA